MRVLITNDDGIFAPGLEVMEEIAAEVAGASGQVWTVAPALEQSGVGHCVSFLTPMMVTKISDRRYAVQGTPADCVLAGLRDVMGSAPDLILSGVNLGNNSGENAVYSGTVGAAMEGALQGVPSIAISQYLGPKTGVLDDPFEAARTHGARTVKALLDLIGLPPKDPAIFYNINFPPFSAAQVKGLRVAPQGLREGAVHMADLADAPSHRRYLWIYGPSQQLPSFEGSDVDWNLKGYATVTPMRADLTDHAALKDLEALE